MGDLTIEGEGLVKRWLGARETLERLRGQVSAAECDLRDAANQLGAWLTPSGDVKIGETFCVWYGDSLISVRVVSPPSHDRFPGGKYELSERKSGRTLRLHPRR